MLTEIPHGMKLLVGETSSYQQINGIRMECDHETKEAFSNVFSAVSLKEAMRLLAKAPLVYSYKQRT